jgi:isopentenyldiphosphate isomerase
MISAPSGILFGMLINTMSSPDLSKSWCAVFNNIFQVKDHPLNYLSWISIGILMFLPVVEWLLDYHSRKRSFESAFHALLKSKISADLWPFSDGRIAIGSALTIQQTPDLLEGWSIENVELKYDCKEFTLPKKLEASFKAYYDENYLAKGFVDDGVKYMLINNPTSFTDSKSLVLELQKCRYSQVQFYKDVVSVNERDNYIQSVLHDLSVSFPHSLCLHLVLVTSDNKILITRRAGKVRYSPHTWSVSMEEQLDKDDFKDGNNKVMHRWLKRLLLEETGVEEENVNISNFKLLSVFLESEIMNCSLCGIVKLDLHSEILDKILKVKPKSDQEFSAWDFLSCNQLKSEFLIPTKELHPTSNYRMYFTLLQKYGSHKIFKELLNIE